MAPALRIPVSVNMDQFQDQMGKMGDLTSKAVRQMEKEFIRLNAQIAIEGVKALAKFGLEVGKLALAIRQVRTGLAIGAAGFAIVGAFEAMAAISDLAKQKMEEFNETAQKATSAGVSTDFFQRWVKGFESLRLSADDAESALKRFAETSKDALGGSALTKRIEELKSFGNLQGNTGVGAFASAIGSEDKLRAMVKLIDQMLDKGERVAALDLAEKAFGPKVTENLRSDSGYLDKMLQSVDAISAKKIIDQEQINTAVDLTNRLDDARKILEEKFKPIQKDITALGLQYQESWIQFYTNLASAITYAQALYDAIKGIPEALATAGKSDFWNKVTEFFRQRGMTSELPPEMQLGNRAAELSPAQRVLASGLRNPMAIQAAQRQATEIQAAVRGDLSKPPPKREQAEAESFYDRQNRQIEKHIALMEADAQAVGLGAGAQEQLRTEAKLYEALLADGITDTEKYADAIYKLSERAGQAADGLAKAQHQLAEINKLGNTLGQALSTAFADAILEGKKLNEVMSQLLKTLARAAINWAIMAPFQAGPGGAASPFAQLFGFGRMAGGPVEQGSSYLVGERGPELFTPGATGMITPNSALRASPGGSGIFHYAPSIDARGASVEAVARLAQIMEADRAAFASRTVAVIQQARRARMPGL